MAPWHPQIAKIIGAEWKALTDSEKAPFLKKQAAAKAEVGLSRPLGGVFFGGGLVVASRRSPVPWGPVHVQYEIKKAAYVAKGGAVDDEEDEDDE